MSGVPDAAEVVLLVLLLQDGDDLRASGNPFTNGYSMGSPKRRPKARNWAGGQALVAEEDDEMIEPDAADRLDRLLAGIPGEVDAGDLGAERARDGMNADRRHGATGSSTTPPPTTDSSPS